MSLRRWGAGFNGLPVGHEGDDTRCWQGPEQSDSCRTSEQSELFDVVKEGANGFPG